MKKILSVLAVAVMLLSLTVSAFAAVSSPTVIDEDEAVDQLEDWVLVDPGDLGPGIYLDVSPTEMASEELSMLDDAIEEYITTVEENEKVTVSVIDVELRDRDTDVPVSEEYFSGGGAPITVAFVRDDAVNVLGLLYWNHETSDWDPLEIVARDENTITARFYHLCTVAFILKEAEPTPVTPVPSTTATPKPGGTPGKKSPQTGGGSSALWTLSAALVLVACGCAIRARKVTDK